eukprot:1328136-Amorphochlora_amoeboformis.AAC.2
MLVEVASWDSSNDVTSGSRHSHTTHLTPTKTKNQHHNYHVSQRHGSMGSSGSHIRAFGSQGSASGREDARRASGIPPGFPVYNGQDNGF